MKGPRKAGLFHLVEAGGITRAIHGARPSPLRGSGPPTAFKIGCPADFVNGILFQLLHLAK
jgi:hypothetical protein